MKIRYLHIIGLIWEVSGDPHKIGYIHYMKIKKLIEENLKKFQDNQVLQHTKDTKAIS